MHCVCIVCFTGSAQGQKEVVCDGGRTDQLVDWLPELGTREPGQEAGPSLDHAELPGTTLEAVETGVLSPPLTSTRRNDSSGSIVPFRPVHPSYLPRCPRLPGWPHCSQWGRCKDSHFPGFPPTCPPNRAIDPAFVLAKNYGGQQ